jgi:hypothetical protein
MEIVLLWLDDLDDLIFAAAMVWRSAARRTLNIGLAAAIALAASCIADMYTSWITELTVVALGSVVVWSLAALPQGFARARRLSLTA